MYIGISEGASGRALGAPAALVRRYSCSAADTTAVEQALKISVAEGALRGAVEAAAREGISWIRQASGALQISPRSAHTRQLFKEAFGTTPEFVPTWRTKQSKWVDRGDLVAMRLNAVAKLLSGGWIRYYCWGDPAHCPECTTKPPTYFACSSWGKRYVICLGERFWTAWQNRDTATMASTLIHEALHIYFGKLIAHGEKGRYGGADCYERFVVRLNGQFLHAATAAACAASP
jgi:hypothetical protein